MILLNIDPRGPAPVYEQVYRQIIRLIESGGLKAGSRLPATRTLAASLGLNRATVYRAYQELWACGYLESRPGSYSVVRERAGTATAENRDPSRAFSWRTLSTPRSRRLHEDYLRFKGAVPAAAPKGALYMTELSADRDLSPVADLRKCVREVLLRKGSEILAYGQPAGYPPLRETIARHMQVHGVSVAPEEILVTDGAQHATELLLKLMTVPGTRVAVESPTYAIAVPLFRFFGVEPAAIPMTDDGLDLTGLEKCLVRRRPAFLYTMPNFQNPTGITTSHAHRENLLSLCERHGVAIVEDGFEEEMKYFGKSVPPVKSMDRSGRVVYLGTFSKVVFPGLRIGWIAARRDCIERLTAIKRFCTLSSSNLGQAAVDRFCRLGYYEQHIRRIHAAYRKRMQTAIRAIRTHFPREGVRWTEPAGGYTLWVHLPETRRSEPSFMEVLAKHGVFVSPGSLFFFTRPPGGIYFRLSICNLKEPQIEEGIIRVGRALREAGRR
jgi:DNA-binding transcriptional MocR family regulator